MAAFLTLPSGTGMARQTSYRFDASTATDPDGDSLTYRWDFAGERSATGQNASHVFDSPGTNTVTLTVSDGDRSAMTSGTVDVVSDMSGTWTGDISAPGVTIPLLVTFAQTLGTLTGTFVAGSPSVPPVVPGTISAGTIASNTDFVCPCAVSITVFGGSTGLPPATFSGTVNGEVTSLTGGLSGGPFFGVPTTLSR